MKVRTIIKLGNADTLLKAQEERARFVTKLRRRRRREKVAAYFRVYRIENFDRIEANKKRWREENRERVNAYYRRYDELTPGRREYKAKKLREYRARDRAVRVQA